MKRSLLVILLSFFSISAFSQVGISTNPVFVPTEELDIDGSVKVREDLILPDLAPNTGRRNLIVKSSGTVDTASAWNYSTSNYGTGSYLCAPNSMKSIIPGLSRTVTLLTPSYITISTDGGIVNQTAAQSFYSIVEVSISVNGNSLDGGGARRIITDNLSGVAGLSNWSLTGTVLLPAGSHTFTVSAMGGAGSVSAIVSSNGITVSSHALSEGFSTGTTAPSGWSFTSIGGTYTSPGNVGQATPSLMMDATDDRIVTPIFTVPVSALSFWIKGLTTNSGSALLVEGSTNGMTWTTIQNIPNNLPGTGIIMSYNSTSSPPLPPGMIQFRFTYTKSSGNLAFDDVTVTTGQNSSYGINQGQMTLQILAR